MYSAAHAPPRLPTVRPSISREHSAATISSALPKPHCAAGSVGAGDSKVGDALQAHRHIKLAENKQMKYNNWILSFFTD